MRMHGKSNGTRICNLSYNVQQPKPLKKCYYCEKVISKRNTKYCSVECQRNYEWDALKINIENGLFVSTKTLKKYLIEKEQNICSECGTGSIWNNKKLMLQMDHIDGNPNNNIYSNVRLLCPNCHTQTPTWGYSLSKKNNEC